MVATHLDKAKPFTQSFRGKYRVFSGRTEVSPDETGLPGYAPCFGQAVPGVWTLCDQAAGKTPGKVLWRMACRTGGQTDLCCMMKADVDEAIRKARTEKQFFYYLREKGYSFKFGKDITLRAAGRDRGLKLARNFGEDLYNRCHP